MSLQGSIQSIAMIPPDVKAAFHTAFELDPRDLIEMAADRGPFIDQSQSLTLFMASPTSTELVSSSFHLLILCDLTTHLDGTTTACMASRPEDGCLLCTKQTTF